MPRLLSIPILLTLATSLASCAHPPTETPPPRAAAQASAPEPAARQAEIRKALAPRCGQATNWTADQKRAVAAIIEKDADDPGMILLAREWRRETQAIALCRGETL